MVHGAGHSASGHHTLGPHVVGTRVVVRRLIPNESGPTGGPAFTDVLGVCERWADGQCVVRREDGTTVTIEIGQIVSGKPVPPRASRLARIPRAEIDAHLDTRGTPVWLGAIAQLTRRLPMIDAAVERHETADAATFTVAGSQDPARVVRRHDWVVCERLPATSELLAHVVEWGAEQGASVLAITDPAAAGLPAELGFLNR